MVPAKDAGIEIYVRNKRPDGMTQFAPRADRRCSCTARPTRRTPLRPPARRPIVDGLHRGSRLRRLPPRPARLRQVDAAAGDGQAAPRRTTAIVRTRERGAMSARSSTSCCSGAASKSRPSGLVVGHHASWRATPPRTRARSSGSCSTRRAGCAPRHRWCRRGQARRLSHRHARGGQGALAHRRARGQEGGH